MRAVWLDVCKDFCGSHAKEGPTLHRILGRLEGSVICTCSVISSLWKEGQACKLFVSLFAESYLSWRCARDLWLTCLD